MIYITGDKHGQIDTFDTPAYKKLKKSDTLIICGDFGFIWNSSSEENKLLKRLQKKKYQIAFLDGRYENFPLLKSYHEEIYCSGKVRRIASNIVWLQRGELYNIEDKKLLVFGGGSAVEGIGEYENVSFLKEAEPEDEQVDLLINNLKRCEGKVDAILTHEPPLSIKNCLEEEQNDYGSIHELLEELRNHSDFSQWFFGRYHLDRKIPPCYRAVFNDVVPLE